MAVVKWVVVETPLDGSSVKLLKWPNLNATDTGLPYTVASYSDKTVQIDGTQLGSGITIEGSIDPTELDNPGGGAGWDTLNDPQGNPLSGITQQKIEVCLEHVYLLRPNCAAGVTGATVWLLLSSTR